MMKMETIFEEHSRNLQPYLGSAEHVQQQQQQQQHHHNHQQQQTNGSNCLSSFSVCSLSPVSVAVSVSASPSAAIQSQYAQNPHYHHYHQQQQYNHHHHHHHQQHQHYKSLHHHSTVVSSSISANNSPLSNHDVVNGSVTANVLLPDLTQTCKMQANAQKEVQDIKF